MAKSIPITQETENKNNTAPLSRFGPYLLFAHLLLSPLVFGRGLVEAFEFPKAALLIITSVLLLALWGWEAIAHLLQEKPQIKTKEKKKRGDPLGVRQQLETLLGIRLSDPITIGISLFLVFAFFSTLFSVSPRTSFYGDDDSSAGLITILSYTILFFGTKIVCKQIDAFRTLFIATLLGAACSVFYAGLQAANLDPFTWKRTSEFGEAVRVFGTMGHPNQLGALLSMGLPIICYFRLRMFEKHAFFPGVALVALEIFSVSALIISLSRGAWLATIAMFIAFIIGMVMITGKKRLIILILIPALIGVLLGRAYFKMTSEPMQSAVEKSAQISSSTDLLSVRTKQIGLSVITEGSRWPIWTAAANMFLDHPLFGVGTDAFRLAFMEYRPSNYWLREWGGTPTRAHNDLLHILATQGGLGAIAVFLLTFGIFRAAMSRLKQLHPDRILCLAVISSAVAFYVQNIFNFTVTGFGTLFITLCAFLSRWGEPEFFLEAKPKPTALAPFGKSFTLSIGRGVIGLVALVVIYLLVLRPLQTSYLVAKTIFNRSLPPANAVLRLEEAVRLDSTKDDYFHHLGAAYRKVAGRAKADPTLRAKSFLSAKAAYQRAIDLVPVDSNNHIKLATLLVVMAKESPPLATPDEVYRAVKMAIQLDPKNADLYLIGADIAISFGDGIRAKRWAEASASIYSHFAPPRAQIGFVALLDAVRVLRANQPKNGEIKLQEAIKNLEQSLPMFWANHEGKKEAAKNDLAKAYLFRARVKEQLGEIENARAAYKKLLQFKPDHSEGISSFKKFQERHPLDVLTLRDPADGANRR
ncbi:MAG: O-antigen ligase family protein [Nitrospirota bacterium]